MIQLEKFMDRWGNQVGQYVFARSLAYHLGVELQTPQWAGQEIFNINDPPIVEKLPSLAYNEIPATSGYAVHGHFQNQRSFDYISRSQARTWLRVRPEILKLCRKPKNGYIACHLRRGDYAKHFNSHYAVIDKVCYQKALSKFGYREKDVIWFTEEVKQPGYNKLPWHLQFVHDFVLIMQADVVFRANSTYSYWAAALGNSKVYSPLVEDRSGFCNDIEFVEGFSPRNFSRKNMPWVSGEDNNMEMRP